MFIQIIYNTDGSTGMILIVNEMGKNTLRWLGYVMFYEEKS